MSRLRYPAQPAQAQQAQHKRIVSVTFHVSKTTIAQHQMDHQKQSHDIEPHDGVMLEVLKAAFQPSAKSQLSDECLNDHQPGKGGQPLIFESKFRNPVDNGVEFVLYCISRLVAS